ncbi:MAG: hypothetical protein QOC77_2167, partial [Thermoleophilaceae bacterium]|nr:hypothetical protein [Thermoleophilaceae bacterium]
MIRRPVLCLATSRMEKVRRAAGRGTVIRRSACPLRLATLRP